MAKLISVAPPAKLRRSKPVCVERRAAPYCVLKAKGSVVVWAILLIAGFVVATSNTFDKKGIREPQRDVNAQMEFRSPLEKEVHRFIEEHPGVSAEKITDFANSILKKEGYIYDFDTCEFIENRKLSPINPKQEQTDDKIYLLPLELKNGIQRRFEIGVSDNNPCGYCYAYIPVINVTSRTILAALNGENFSIKRPEEFTLEEMELVDVTTRKVIRRWEVPNQTYPLGISADGQTLYLPVWFTDYDHDANMWWLWKRRRKSYPASVLAISPTGIRFEVAGKVLANQASEDLEDFRTESDNDYVGYRRFNVKDKTYIIRFSYPCV